MIKSLDKAAMRAIRTALDSAMVDLSERVGVSLTIGRGSFDPLMGTGYLKVEIAVAGEQGDIVPPHAVALDQFAKLYGFPTDVRGKTVRIGGKVYVIEGMKLSGRKYPLLLRNQHNQKLYKFPINDVKRALGITVPAPEFLDEELAAELQAEAR